MTDNEIIKALEGCSCDTLELALDLINRQKAEIERYEKENNEKFNKWEVLDRRTKERYSQLYEEAKSVLRAKAIEEFAERLKEKDGNEFIKSDYEGKDEIYWFDQPEYESFVDNLVKEMVGD